MVFDKRRIVSEAIGTFFLVLMGPGAVMVNAVSNGAVTHLGVALAFGFVVLVMVYALGNISGAHLNPAVTLALCSVNRFSFRDVVPYIMAQCFGAVSGAFVLRIILGKVGDMGATFPTIPTMSAFGMEVLLSFLLMFVIMTVVADDRTPKAFAPISIGLAVSLCALMGGPLTGASMNPARSLGPALIGGIWDRHWIYWLAPVVGMLLAAHIYEWLQLVADEINSEKSGRL